MSKSLLAIGVLVAAVLLFVLWPNNKSEVSTLESETHASSAKEEASEGPKGRNSAVLPQRLGSPKSAGMSGVVSGTVIESGSKEPVPWVDIVFRSRGEEASTTSDESGRYNIELAAGQYEVRAVGEKVIAKSMPRLRIGSTKTVSLDVPVDLLGTIRGKTLNPEGFGLGDVELTVRSDTGAGKNYPSQGEVGLGASDSDGSFELRVPPGAVELEAVLGNTTVFASVPKVEPGGVVDNVAIVIDQRCAIGGTVRLPDGDVAVGATVRVTLRRTGTSHFVHQEVTTDSAGMFRVENLSPVAHGLEVVADGFGSSDPQVVTLTAEQPEVDVEVVLHRPETLSGIVVDENGTPVSGVRVAQVRNGSRQFYNKVNTYSDGAFSFEEIAPGPHRLRASKEGYADAYLKDVMASKTDIVLKLVPSGSLRGTVTTSKGEPVERFVVRYWPTKGKAAKGKGTSSQFFASDGSFQIYPINAGDYRVQISAEGIGTANLDVVNVAAGGYGDASATLSEAAP